MHNHDDKYPARPGFEPGTSRLQAPVDTNEYRVLVAPSVETIPLMVTLLPYFFD